MATLKKQTPKIQAEHQIEQISMVMIAASKTNPRQSFEKENIKDLADSMASVGLLQPVTLRSTGKASYEIVAGERRWRAAKLLKWETIPAIVREISDEEMLEFQIIENLQREDVSPLDEAHAFKTLLQKESLDSLVSMIHKPKKYILDRLKLNELVPEAAEMVSNGILPLGHAVVISKLSFSDQKACLDKCIESKYVRGEDNMEYCSLALDDLKDFIQQTVMLDFDKAPFDKDDETLYPDAGSCAACPKRTCNSNLLFQDITSDDKCTDASCFQEKIKLHVEREKSKAKETHGTVLAGERPTYNSHTHVKVQGVEVPIQKVQTKNSIPVVITKVDRYGGNQHLGETVYVDKKKVEQVKAAKAEAPKQRNGHAEYQAAAKKDFIEKVWPKLEYISKIDQAPESIVKEFFREKLSSYSIKNEALALAGVIGYNGFAKSAEQAYDERDGYSFGFTKEMIDRLIAHYTTDHLIVIIMLLNEVDEDHDRHVDQDDEFGMNWNQMQEILTPKKKSK